MIIPYVVSYSLVFGAILSNGIMWPLLSKHEGDWYPAGLTSQDFQGIFGYKVLAHASPVIQNLSPMNANFTNMGNCLDRGRLWDYKMPAIPHITS